MALVSINNYLNSQEEFV